MKEAGLGNVCTLCSIHCALALKLRRKGNEQRVYLDHFLGSNLSFIFQVWMKSEQQTALPTWTYPSSLMEVDDSWGFLRLHHH
jgi:hypothetical protein